MIKKICILLILLMLVTGCEAVYTIEVTGDGITETLEIHNYDKDSWTKGNSLYQNLIETASKSFVATDYRNEKPEVNQKIEGINYYIIQKISSPNDLGLKYQNEFTFNDYEHSTIVFSNFNQLKYRNNRDKISINSDKELSTFISYPKLNKLTVKLLTNYQVNDNNADEVKDGVYYWYFNQDDYQNKKINLEINKSREIDNLKILQIDEKGYFGKNTLIGIYTFLGLILLVGGGIIFFKIKNSNR